MLFLPGRFPLYFVTDANLNAGRSKLEVIESALRGGAKLIQFRDKNLDEKEFEIEARNVLELCRKHGATLILNDCVSIAKRIGADGVHLGQDDMNLIEARTILGPEAIIGLSTHDESEVRAAENLPVSYINIGPMFPTGTKQHLHALGVEEVLRLSKLTSHLWTTMGGIKQNHLPELFSRGIKTVAMVTEISLADDVEKRTLEILAEIIPTFRAKVVVREIAEKGKSLFATQPFSKGDMMGYFEGHPIDHATQHSVTLDGITWEPTGPLGFLSHSCSPNAFFAGRWLIAASHIQTDDEIAIDYLATEKQITHGFFCSCGSKNCRGWIG